MISPKPVPPPVTRMRLPRSRPSSNISSKAPSACPPAMQAGDDVLQPCAVLPIHLQALERMDFVQLPQELALDLIRDRAFDEGDHHQPLARCDRDHLVQGGGRIDHHRARLAFDRYLLAAEMND